MGIFIGSSGIYKLSNVSILVYNYKYIYKLF